MCWVQRLYTGMDHGKLILEVRRMTSISKIRHRERRWIVLGEDGRHVTIGRHSDPADSEIANLEQSLGDQGLTGWLVIAEGDYWARRGRVSLLMVRPLRAPQSSFETAASAFEVMRQQALQPA